MNFNNKIRNFLKAASLGAAAVAAGVPMLACGRLPTSQVEQPFGIKRSDVVMTVVHSVDVYRQYKATFLAWGFLPQVSGMSEQVPMGEQVRIECWHHWINEAHSVGMRFQGRVELDAGWQIMIDFDPNFMDSVCRNLDGEPVTTPWFWDMTYQGHPAYYFCTNSPGFRACLKHQVQQVLSGGPDVLMIDSQTSTAAVTRMGGCFCHWCMEGFRKYLAGHADKQTLARYGIDSLDGFDYGAFLRVRGVTWQQFAEKLKAWPPVIPLTQQYLSFQYTQAKQWVTELHRYAGREAGSPIPLSVSDNSWLLPNDLFAVALASHLCCEWSFEASSGKLPCQAIFAFKLADALNKRVMATGQPQQDWATINKNNAPGLVRCWIALTYALGHNFMVPPRMWSITLQDEGRGTHWYQSKPGDFELLYHFIRAHADLFDGYESVAHVGVLYSNMAFRRGSAGARDECIDLVLDNVPVQVVIAGDDWMPERLELSDLEDLDALVVTEPTYLDTAQKAVLDAVANRVVVWPDREKLFSLLPRQIEICGATNVTVIPRAKKDDAQASFVCHLVNRNYQADHDAMAVQKNFTLRISPSLFGSMIDRVILHTPGKDSVELVCKMVGDAAEITVPELDLWAVLELHRANQDRVGSQNK